jgi:transposase-like protein
MPAPRKHPNELRERAQRLVAESMSEDPSLTLNGTVKRVGPRVGVVSDTMRGCVKQAVIDAGQRPGVTTADASRGQGART